MRTILVFTASLFFGIAYADPDCSDEVMADNLSMEYRSCNLYLVSDSQRQTLSGARTRILDVIAYLNEKEKKVYEWERYLEVFDENVHEKYVEAECNFREIAPGQYGTGQSLAISYCVNDLRHEFAKKVSEKVDEIIDSHFPSGR